ncbi:hypothetical protein ES705_49128 [subsurface metagenome]
MEYKGFKCDYVFMHDGMYGAYFDIYERGDSVCVFKAKTMKSLYRQFKRVVRKIPGMFVLKDEIVERFNSIIEEIKNNPSNSNSFIEIETDEDLDRFIKETDEECREDIKCWECPYIQYQNENENCIPDKYWCRIYKKQVLFAINECDHRI